MTNRRIIFKPIPAGIEQLVREHGGSREAVLEILKDLDRQGGLNPESITDTARSLGLPAHQVYGMATFYSMLSLQPRKDVVRICDGPVCSAKKAAGLSQALEGEAEGTWSIERSSCLGLCDRAPAVLVGDEQAGPVEIDNVHKFLQGWCGNSPDYSQPRKGESRVMLANAGKVDPDSIDSALAHGAYAGLGKALSCTSGEILETIEASGLQGRGGAGFPVGRKWRFVAQAQGNQKYILANADESEPLIFKDRVLLDVDPHQILEGMAIAGYACGANEAFIYIRGEYEPQARRLENAIAQAGQKGWLGQNIQGTHFTFNIHVHRGAGAYICGEETALIESLEGKRGEPRLRPPYPPSRGFRGCPTAVNNIESFAAVRHIINHGTEWWKTVTSYPVPGTKLYMLSGQVRKPGLFEAPFGLTLRQVIDDFGGGMQDGSNFHFALTGGAAGTLVDQSLLDVPMDYGSSAKGISLGAGGFLVCDQTANPVILLGELLHFFEVESCGKCTPCRIGTWRAREILDRMVAGNGRPGDVAELRALADNLLLSSLCGLGQSASIPIHSALAHFEDEFQSYEHGWKGSQ
jgi:NADH:ubiquinone oxidoreductase subunit F (NADH-binding)/NADH:ubiquinone oxidoreductase subunit E